MCPGSNVNVATANVLTNKKWVLSARPSGAFSENDTNMPTEEIDLEKVVEMTDGSTCTSSDAFHISPDEVLVKVEALSIDAFIRTMLDEEAFHGSVSIGDTMPAMGIGKVLKSGSQSKLREGDTVIGMLGAQTIAKVKSSGLNKSMLPMANPTLSLGLLGVTGLTAYVGTFSVTQGPKKGETVVVSAAAGATGSVAAQLAKIAGARVVGIAGGTKKTKFLLEDLGLDAAIDYKDTSKSVREQLSETCPDGIDFFYDNVGGEILDAVIEKINMNARIVICGAVSQYSGNLNKGKVQGPSNYLKLAEKSATMKGFALMNESSSFPAAIAWLLYYYNRGLVKLPEHVENGIEKFAAAMVMMFNGGYIGRTIVDVAGVKNIDVKSSA
eukprot:CAMPEP_0172497302 /NCGR_PEP_ID=MMETSP1066-20121228/97939_1 /TAXON_ID=671091 /ORGANISM="Coscinodiscus wailesii, Strain CCMP2513" /LENGTH=382 /DNA_ID=CAMNT_0013269983 /DNA_START=230 /DNA_END=1378 /DNA_ORIENTATION=+